METVQGMRHAPFDYGFRAPWHLLIATEITECHDNKTFVESPVRSALRDFTRTLTFVPAGHGLRRFLKPRAPTRTTYFYIDPRWPPADLELRFGKIEFKPRNEGAWDAVRSSDNKLFRQIEAEKEQNDER